MSTLEVLMKAEQSLLDESIPFVFTSYADCTCGHILRAVEGERGYAGTAGAGDHSEYVEVIKEVAVALGYQGESERGAIAFVSNHTLSQYVVVTRKSALKTVRTAMLALQPAEPVVEYATA